MNLTEMTIVSTTAGKTPLEEMEQASWLTKESEMQYLDAVSKTTVLGPNKRHDRLQGLR